MARVGGRNAAFAWIIGVGCAAAVGALAVLALPMLPASVSWFGGAVNGPSSTTSTAGGDASPTASPTATAAAGATPPASCEQLYDEALWADLRVAPGSTLTSSTDAPETTATAVVAALQPRVTLTCAWRADQGTVVTTLAVVPADAGPIAAAALPHSGFSCTAQVEHARCTRTDGDLIETIEAGGGLWLSTSERGWHPGDYAGRTGARVWSP